MKRPHGTELRLTLVAVLFVACVTGGFWKLTSVANKANRAAAESRVVAAKSRAVAAESRRVAKLLDARVVENARTIRDLCDRGYILDDLVVAAIALVKTPPNPPSDVAFVRLFEADHSAIVDSLTKEDSPCNTG